MSYDTIPLNTNYRVAQQYRAGWKRSGKWQERLHRVVLRRRNVNIVLSSCSPRVRSVSVFSAGVAHMARTVVVYKNYRIQRPGVRPCPFGPRTRQYYVCVCVCTLAADVKHLGRVDCTWTAADVYARRGGQPFGTRPTSSYVPACFLHDPMTPKTIVVTCRRSAVRLSDTADAAGQDRIRGKAT